MMNKILRAIGFLSCVDVGRFCIFSAFTCKGPIVLLAVAFGLMALTGAVLIVSE